MDKIYSKAHFSIIDKIILKKRKEMINLIIHYLFRKDAIKIVDRKKKFQNYTVYKYNFLENLRNNDKKILVSNLGYNFNKIVKFFKKKDYNIYIPIFNKISILRKFIFFCRGIHLIKFKKDLKSKVSKKNLLKKLNSNIKNIIFQVL